MIKEKNPNFKGFWAVYNDYEIKNIDEEYYIQPVKDADCDRYNVFDVEKELLVDFLKIGKLSEDYKVHDLYCTIQSNEKEVQELVLDFVKKYGLIGEEIFDFSDTEKAKYIESEHYMNINEYSAEKVSSILVQAKLLYYTFNHIETYLDNDIELELPSKKSLAALTINDFKLKNIECSLELKDKRFFMFNFTSLVQAMKVILMLQETNDRKEIKMCKRCGKPFIAKNINADYCSTTCRNVANVYKSREKKKKK